MPAVLENSALVRLEKVSFISIPKKGNTKECSNYCTPGPPQACLPVCLPRLLCCFWQLKGRYSLLPRVCPRASSAHLALTPFTGQGAERSCCSQARPPEQEPRGLGGLRDAGRGWGLQKQVRSRPGEEPGSFSLSGPLAAGQPRGRTGLG